MKRILFLSLTVLLTGCAAACPFVIRVELPASTEPETVAVYDSSAERIVEMNADEYLVGVLAGEMPAGYETAALQAQAVAARTYLAYRQKHGGCDLHPGAAICTDAAHCQAYLSPRARRERWGEQADAYEQKLTSAVTSTAEVMLYYENEPILALFHANSGGETADCREVFLTRVPYLSTVPSEEPPQESTLIWKREELAALLGESDVPRVDEVGPSGRVLSVQAGSRAFSGNEIRSLLGLPSTAFSIESDGKSVIFHCLGYGHGVGMSQQGADTLARQGKTYEQILLYYYTGARLENGKKTETAVLAEQ